MKHLFIRSAFILTALICFHINPLSAQSDCEVLLEDISGEYEGDCKKGLADGQGTASGKDTYVGEFKKGLPHGVGKYTWANGDVYDGEFRKGIKDGAGKLIKKLEDGGTIEQVGYWKDDEYIGESSNPYEIINRSPGILSVRVSQTDNPSDDGNAIFVEILHKGRRQPSPDFGLNVTSGAFQNRFPVGNKTKILVSQFPFAFTMNYMGETLELQFSQPTSWSVVADYNK